MATPESEDGRVFLIDGGRYPMVDVASFTMAERRVLYDRAGVVQEDFLPEEDESEEDHDARVLKMTRHPGFMEALMHVALARGRPKLSQEQVARTISYTVFADAIAEWGDELEEEGEPEGHPTEPSTSEQPEQSPNGTDLWRLSSGPGSPSSSDEPVPSHVSTGAIGSGM